MTVKLINTILVHIVFGFFALCVVFFIWGSFIAYVEYVKGKLKTGISQVIFSLSVFATELLGAAVALFFKDSSVKIFSTNVVLAINATACVIFFVFLFMNWRRLWFSGNTYLLSIISSKRVVFEHITILIMAASVVVNILDASRPTQAFSVTFSGHSRNAHIFFTGNTGLKYSRDEGQFTRNNDEQYGIVLKFENNELFPLNVSVRTYVSTDEPIRMQMPEHFENYKNLPAFDSTNSVPTLGSSNIPLFLSEKAIPDLINTLITTNDVLQNDPLSFYAVSRIEVNSRKDVGLSDIYYINSHVYATTKIISIGGGLDVFVPTAFSEGVSVNSAVSVDRKRDKDNVTIDPYYDLLSYSCQVVSSPYELLLVNPSVRHNVSEDEAKDFVSGKKVGRIDTDCIYVLQDEKKVEIDKAKAAIQFLKLSPSTSIIRMN